MQMQMFCHSVASLSQFFFFHLLLLNTACRRRLAAFGYRAQITDDIPARKELRYDRLPPAASENVGWTSKEQTAGLTSQRLWSSPIEEWR